MIPSKLKHYCNQIRLGHLVSLLTTVYCAIVLPMVTTGGQCTTIGDTSYNLNFDGWKCYLRVMKPCAEDLLKYHIPELTSPLPHEPQRKYPRRLQLTPGVSLDDWRVQVGYPTYDTNKSTLNNTTHMVQNL